MGENQDYEIGKSMLNDLTKEVDSLRWAAFTLDMIVGDNPILSTEERADITVKVESLLKDCDIIEKKISTDNEALALVNFARGRLYAIYIPAKGFPVPHFKTHKNQAIDSYKKSIELSSFNLTKGLGRANLGKLYSVWGDNKEAIENLEQAVSLLTIDEPAGMEAAKELERLKTEKKGMCFIATAVYNNHSSPQIKLLKEFRDNNLSTSFFGRWMTESYCTVSPFFADILEQNKILKKMVKILIISPVVVIIKKLKN